jgi:polysaccharide pyruvyl transferase WcaK-like protein
MDLVITTRLHGAVLALKNGVPVLALDSVRGGAKVLRQMQTIDWPWRFEVSSVSTDALDEAFDQLLRPEAQAAARRVAERSTAQVETSGALLVEWLTGRDRP